MVTKEEINEICKHALELWGQGAQEDMMIEECSELTKALLKARRKPTMENAMRVVEEIVDVELMLKQMKYIFLGGLQLDKEYFAQIEYKVNRLKNMINSAELKLESEDNTDTDENGDYYVEEVDEEDMPDDDEEEA